MRYGMGMDARDRWLTEGLAVLREQGIVGVRVDRIATRLKLTKGSFHHHFNGVDDFRRALLGRYEAEVTASIEEARSAVLGLSPEQALRELSARAPFDPRLDAAVRGWAFHDEVAREALQRTDAARLDALTELWLAVLGDSHRAKIAALVPHLVMIGASVSTPVPTEADVADVFALLAHLVPSVSGSSPR